MRNLWKSKLVLMVTIGFLAVIISWLALNISASTDEKAMGISGEDCVSVDIQDLYSNPLLYQETEICTSGFARFQYDWLTLVPERFPSSELRVQRIELGLHQSNSLLQTLLTDDLITVQGVFWVNPDCLYAFENQGMDREGKPFLCQDVNVPMGIDVGDAEINSRPSLGDDCEHVPFELLQQYPNDFDNMIVCTEARVERSHSEVFLKSNNGLDWEGQSNRRVVLTPSHPVARSGDIRNGDILSLIGRFSTPPNCYRVLAERPLANTGAIEFNCFGDTEPAGLDAAEIEVTNRVADHASCQQVQLETLYAQPLSFAGRVICTTGIFVTRNSDTPHPTIAIVPQNYSEEQQRELILSLNLHREAVNQRSLTDGMGIQVRGRVDIVEDCYRQQMGLPQNDPEGILCMPTPIPFWIEYPETTVVN